LRGGGGAAAAVEGRRLFPELVDGGFGGQLDGLRGHAGQIEQCAHDAGVAAAALLEGGEDDVDEVRDLPEEGGGLAWRLRRGELERHRQVVGHLPGGQMEAGALVGLRQVDQRRPALARVAVHVLEEVQRGAAAAVEELHVVGFGVQRVLPGELGEQGFDLGQARGRQRAFLAQRGAKERQVRAQHGVGVGEQARQHAQRARHRARCGPEEAHVQISALMGMVRRFSLPKRLVSPMPSLQPLPKLKPQPPRTLKAFSAYSRCVVGMTKRSS